MIELISLGDLPDDFSYPRGFIRILELGVTDLEPWSFLDGKELRIVYSGLRQRYPDQGYVPFATRQDNDDVACWSHAPPEVIVVHDRASPGWERRGRKPHPNFHAWLRAAVEDCIIWGEIELGL